MFIQSSADKFVVGYDLNNDYSQISYYTAGSDEVNTLSLVAGAQVYNIPTVLCKRSGVNQWFYGKEALKYEQEKEGVLVKNLLQLALEGEPILVEEESLSPVALLTLFFKRSLGLLSQVGSADKISALMITCDKLDYRTIEVLSEVVAGLKLKTERVFFQGYAESFYHYMIHQPKELWQSRVLLFDYADNNVRVCHMECNKKTTPIVAFIDSEERELPMFTDSVKQQEMLDERFQRIAQDAIEGHIVSSVYLVGEQFSEEWMKQSLRYLCRNRRVFIGNNLYSKGACYGMLERIQASEEGKTHVFLGNDKLKSNIGMRLMRLGEEAYVALLDAGVNWYEAEQTLELYIQKQNTLELTATSLIGKGGKNFTITLEDLKEDVSRIRLHLYLREENCLVAEVEDLGFGEFRETTHHVWREELDLS